MSTVIEDLIVRLTSEGNLTSTTDASTSSVNKLTGALKTMASAGLGAAVGLMIQQGAALDTATQKLAADTGLSGQALTDQGAAIDSMYKTSLESMDSIEASLAEVISGFKLTGQAADDLTAQFLRYEEATGQSSDAVTSMKMVTDAWNLTAAQEGALMDQLVASHQQFGTSVGDMQTALQKIAPAMQAMGMSEKDGVDLLNMFAAAGIDSTKAAMGLQTAVKALKPGESLNDLIVQISSIQDPLARAQEAGKVFGTRLGSQMADALAPGITSLDQFSTSSQDTIGATDKAAQAVEDSWGNRFTLLMHQAGGTLATFGQSFGPLLMVGANLGPKMAAGLGSLAGAIIPVLTGQLGIAGAAAGTAEVEAEAGVIAAGGPEIAAAVATTTPEVAAAGTAMGASIGAAALVAIPAALIAGGLGLGAILGNISIALLGASTQTPGQNMNPITGQTAGPNPTLPQADGSYGSTWAAPIDYAANIGPTDQMISDAANASAAAATKEIDAAQTASANALEMGQSAIAAAAKDGYAGILTAAQAVADEVLVKQNQSIDAQAAAITAGRSKLASAWTAALSDSTAAQTVAFREQSNLADIADTQKQIADKKTWDKLTIQQQDALKEQLITQQANQVTLLEEDANYGTDQEKQIKLSGLLASKALRDGLASTDPDTVAMWTQVQSDTTTALGKLNSTMSTGGKTAGTSFGAAMEAAINTTSILSGMTVTTSGTKVQVTTGGNRAYAAGTPYVPSDQWAFLHKGEAVITASQNASGGGKAQITLTVNNPTPEPASTSIQRELLKLASLGYVS